MAPLGVHPAGGFARGPCDASPRCLCWGGQSPILGVATLVASAAALAVLAALVAVDLVTRSAAAVLFLAVVAVRLAEVRVAAADFLTTLVVVSASRWIDETTASRTALASWRLVVSVAL